MKSLREFNFKKIVDVLVRIWKRVHMFLFFIFLIVSISFGLYIWQQSLYGDGWTEERKQEFIKAQNSGVVFNEENFQKVVNDVQRRQGDISQYKQQLKEIFTPYK